jgi:osmotically-inducible protein OsmY
MDGCDARGRSRSRLHGGVKATDLDVDTGNSVVTLTGQVATQAEKQLALRLARDTDGVRNIVDHIQVAKR